jgi:hypothetical protein
MPVVSRRRQLEKKRKKGILPVPRVDLFDSADPRERGRAVRSTCPCRVGWDGYEEHRDEAERLIKDEDPVVRFNALHVREDAVLMELLTDKRAAKAEAVAQRGDRDVQRRDTLERRARARAKRTPAGVKTKG